MTTTTTRRNLLAGAAAVPLLPAAAVAGARISAGTGLEPGRYGPDLDAPGIDWPAVRERIAYAGDVLEIPPAEVRAVQALSDSELDEGLAVIQFGRDHEISLDWLVAGDLCSLLRIWRQHYRPDHKPDPAVAAFQEWYAARERLRPVNDRFGVSVPLTEEYRAAEAEMQPLKRAEKEALAALASVTATTAEGARGQLRALVYMLGSCRWGGDDTDPEDNEIGYYGDPDADLDGQMARAVNRGLRGMQA